MKEKIISALMLLLAQMMNCFESCVVSNLEPDYKEYGDFIYEIVFFYDLDETGTVKPERTKHKGIRIMGLSEEGKQKEVIIIPEYIDNLKVEELGENITFWGSRGDWEENYILKRVYILTNIKSEIYAFSDCYNLEKIIMLSHNDMFFEGSGGLRLYITSYNYNDDVVGNYYLGYRVPLSGFANVSYFYNYDNAPNDNYYWIDDYDYGEKIEFIPPAPTRAGYTFGGWYKESECINKWNFEIDRLPDYLFSEGTPPDPENYRPIYQETKLYAKWIEKA